MTEINETISRREIGNFFWIELMKIKDKVQENYSEKLYVERRGLYIYKQKEFLFFEIKGFIGDILVDIETNIFEKTGKIICTVNDAFIFPIVKEELIKFLESHEELKIKEIRFVKNFS